MAEEERSLFAGALRELLDDTGVLTREEWARTLGVTKQAISQWVNDRTIPRPDVLQGILDFFVDARGRKKDIVDRFTQLARMDSREVSPHAERLGPTVGDYLLEPLMRGFFRNFNPLPAIYKAEVLYRASELCRDFARTKVRGEAPKAQPNSLEHLLSTLREVPEDRRQRVIAAMLTSLSRDEAAPRAILAPGAGVLPDDSPDAAVFGMLTDAQADNVDWDQLVQSLEPFHDDPPRIEMLIAGLHSFLAAHGCCGLCVWYTRTVEAGGEALPSGFAVLGAGLRYHLVAPGALGERDGYAVLVGHQLRARDRPLTPDELLRIAGLAGVAGEALVVEALHNIWGLRERLLIEEAKIPQPWSVAHAPGILELPAAHAWTLFTESDHLELTREEQEADAALLMRVEDQALQQTSLSQRRAAV